MWSHTLFRLGLAASLLGSATLAQAETDYPGTVIGGDKVTQIAPLAGWNLDYGEQKCRLTRTFGTQDDPHFLSFEQAAPGASFGLVLAGSQIRRYRSASNLEIGLQRDAVMRDFGFFYSGDVGNFGPALIKSSFGLVEDPEDSAEQEAVEGTSTLGIPIEEAAKIDRIVLRKGSRALSLETGNMSAPFKALNDCTMDLLTNWGLDPEQHRSFTPVTWANAMTVAKKLQEDYPSKALRRGEQAVFRFHVIVEEDGRVSDCQQVKSTDTRMLETKACLEMMRRAIFTPARDANGDPMRSFYATTISYRI